MIRRIEEFPSDAQPTPHPPGWTNPRADLSRLAIIRLPDPQLEVGDFNNTINPPQYQPSSTIYAGLQRRGIVESPHHVGGGVPFLDMLYGLISPFRPNPAPPDDIKEALHFTIHNDDLTVNNFRPRQLQRLEDLAT